MNKKPISFIALILTSLSLLLFLPACSSMRASPAETSPFLTHGDLLKPWYDRAPWDAVWSSDPGQIMVKKDNLRNIFVSPVNTQYLNLKKDSNGNEVQKLREPIAESDEIAKLLQQSFINAINEKPDTNLKIVDKAEDADLVLELALVELVPTKVFVNSVADVGGMLLPGSKLTEEAIAAGGQAAGGAWAAGSIAMEFKLSDRVSGNVIAEAKDRESDPGSIVPNYRDFEKYGWTRKTVHDWGQQFAEIFSTPVTTRVKPDSVISIAPW